MIDDSTYGFAKADALELVQLIGNADGEHKDWHDLAGSGDGAILYKATMKSTWSSNTVNCDIYSIDGTTFTDTGTDANVYDGLSIFASLTTGASMLVLLQAGKYYAIQAPCP